MYIALDEFGKRVNINDAIKGKPYFCPVCQSPVVIKDGEINATHYSHKANACLDDWNYDMSEWHRRMQSYFPAENTEVVVEYKGKIHRADVMVNDIVIEFQHSPITANEFIDRNSFFTRLGKRIAWVFDVSEQFDNETLQFSEDDDRPLLIWKNPLRIFSSWEKITDYSKNYAVWIYFESDGFEQIQKIIWTAKDEDGNPSLKRFITSNSIYLDDSDSIDAAKLFYSKVDYFNDALAELKNKYPYSVKHRGERGFPSSTYICPKTPGNFGIEIFGESGCCYCKYCYMISKRTRYDKTAWDSYCCYPNQVRKVLNEFETHPGYECERAEIYEI